MYYRSMVHKVEPQKVLLKTGHILQYRKLIVATFPEAILPEIKRPSSRYVGTGNFYFKAKEIPMQAPIIGLVPDEKKLVNTFCVLSQVSPHYSNSGIPLISVTINKYVKGFDLNDYLRIVREEMTALLGDSVKDWEFLKHYNISKALPVLQDVKYDIDPSDTQVSDNVFLAGDHLLNPSLDAAMRSGRRAAEAVIQSLKT
jgi:hypothetical protein